MGILLCEEFFWNVWIRNKSVRAEIGQILHTDTHPHTHTTAAKLEELQKCEKYPRKCIKGGKNGMEMS